MTFAGNQMILDPSFKAAGIYDETRTPACLIFRLPIVSIDRLNSGSCGWRVICDNCDRPTKALVVIKGITGFTLQERNRVTSGFAERYRVDPVTRIAYYAVRLIFPFDQTNPVSSSLYEIPASFGGRQILTNVDAIVSQVSFGGTTSNATVKPFVKIDISPTNGSDRARSVIIPLEVAKVFLRGQNTIPVARGAASINFTFVIQQLEQSYPEFSRVIREIFFEETNIITQETFVPTPVNAPSVDPTTVTRILEQQSAADRQRAEAFQRQIDANGRGIERVNQLASQIGSTPIVSVN